jgi:hypothetical protein
MSSTSPSGAARSPRSIVLVIDDDDDTRTAICELLEDHG